MSLLFSSVDYANTMFFWLKCIELKHLKNKSPLALVLTTNVFVHEIVCLGLYYRLILDFNLCCVFYLPAYDFTSLLSPARHLQPDTL